MNNIMETKMTKLDKAIKATVDKYGNLVGCIEDAKDLSKKSGEDIDVRLCLDFSNEKPVLFLRTGLVDYDEFHSEFCAANIVNKTTTISYEDATPVLEELINELLKQVAESET
jgi:hypothetical protein